MISNNLILKNNINLKKLKGVLSKKFEKIFLNIEVDIENNKKTINILSNKFKFNFKTKDLKKFKKFKTIALIGMGGSILGAEAIYNFLQKKLKRKFIFLIILTKIK